jgi:hypothetical protein
MSDRGWGPRLLESRLAKAANPLLVAEALWSLVSGLLHVAAGLMIYKLWCQGRVTIACLLDHDYQLCTGNSIDRPDLPRL